MIGLGHPNPRSGDSRTSGVRLNLGPSASPSRANESGNRTERLSFNVLVQKVFSHRATGIHRPASRPRTPTTIAALPSLSSVINIVGGVGLTTILAAQVLKSVFVRFPLEVTVAIGTRHVAHFASSIDVRSNKQRPAERRSHRVVAMVYFAVPGPMEPQ